MSAISPLSPQRSKSKDSYANHPVGASAVCQPSGLDLLEKGVVASGTDGLKMMIKEGVFALEKAVFALETDVFMSILEEGVFRACLRSRRGLCGDLLPSQRIVLVGVVL